MWIKVAEGEERKGALLLSPRVWESIEEHGWRGLRIVWVVGEIGIVNYAWVWVYVLANVSNGRGKEEMRKFWNDVNECLRSFERGSRIVLMGDMNGRVGSNEVAGVVGK